MTEFLPDHYESQYSILDEYLSRYGRFQMGDMSSFTWNRDPKRLLFVLSRYKAVASMLDDETHVLEVGCGDAFGSRIVKQFVRDLTVSDADQVLINSARKLGCPPFEFDCVHHDFLVSSLTSESSFTSAFLLDVLEHIPREDQNRFLTNINNSLTKPSKVIIGMPSYESQSFASPESLEGHVNCQTKRGLRSSLLEVYNTVTVFSMNDEVLHTGFDKMSNYLLALCTI